MRAAHVGVGALAMFSCGGPPCLAAHFLCSVGNDAGCLFVVRCIPRATLSLAALSSCLFSALPPAHPLQGQALEYQGNAHFSFFFFFNFISFFVCAT